MSNNENRIPINNIFYLLSYAWNVLPILDEVKVQKDEFSDAYNLLGRVFAFGLGKLIRSGFNRSYTSRTESMTSLRGKINLQASINSMSILRKQLCCDYDEYSSNVDFNQIIKYTIDSLLRNQNIQISIKKDLKQYHAFFINIDSVAPTKAVRKNLIYNRNNENYKLLINIAIMLYDNTSVNEKEGTESFKDFFRKEQMHKVFELFILNFYSIKLPKSTYRVHAPKIDWQMDSQANDEWSGIFDIDMNPGDRRTDIVIENKVKRMQIIIDAKYYYKTFVDAYMNSEDERVRANHLNQVRGYLIDSTFDGKRIGALVYPMTTRDLNRGKVFPVLPHNIIVKTLNLCDDWTNIEADMLNFIKRIER